MDKFELQTRIEQNRADQEWLCEEQRRLEAKLMIPDEPTYSIGDRFKHKRDGGKHIIVGWVDGVYLVCLGTGAFYKGNCLTNVAKRHHITKDELNEIMGNPSRFTRYWDNKKQELI